MVAPSWRRVASFTGRGFDRPNRRGRRAGRRPGGVGDALVGHVRGEAAVDDDLGTVVVRRVVRDQEHDRRGDVGRRTPTRPSGISASAASVNAGEADAISGVSTRPGITALTRMPCAPSSSDAVRVRPRSAHLLEVYAAAAWPAIAATEQMLTIEEPGAHQRHQGLDAEHRAGDVDVEGALPGLEGDVRQPLAGGDAGVVDQRRRPGRGPVRSAVGECGPAVGRR